MNSKEMKEVRDRNKKDQEMVSEKARDKEGITGVTMSQTAIFLNGITEVMDNQVAIMEKLEEMHGVVDP